MIDDVLSDCSDQDQLVLPLWVYLQELACPYSVLYKLTPAIVLRKVCRDCAVNPTRTACMRRRRVPTTTAPRDGRGGVR